MRHPWQAGSVPGRVAALVWRTSPGAQVSAARAVVLVRPRENWSRLDRQDCTTGSLAKMAQTGKDRKGGGHVAPCMEGEAVSSRPATASARPARPGRTACIGCLEVLL